MKTKYMTLPPTKFKCDTCGAEWNDRRGNHNTKVGDICGAVKSDGTKYFPCKGKLVGIN